MKTILRTLYLIFLISFYACSSRSHSKSEIELVSKKYDTFLIKHNADSLASIFTSDASIGEIHGEKEIKEMFRYTSGGRVLSRSSVSDSIGLIGTKAIQKGSYKETVILGETDTINIVGKFVTTWQWNNMRGWLIKSLETSELKTSMRNQ